MSRRCPVFINLGASLGYTHGMSLFVFELYDFVKSLFSFWTILRVAGVNRSLIPVTGPINLTPLLLQSPKVAHRSRCCVWVAGLGRPLKPVAGPINFTPLVLQSPKIDHRSRYFVWVAGLGRP